MQYSSSSGHGYSSGNLPENMFNTQLNISRLENDNKISFYAAVYSESGGYYNWVFKQDFILNSTNYYSMELDNPIDSKIVNLNKSYNHFWLHGFLNNRLNRLTLYSKNYYGAVPQNSVELFYPFNIPVEEFRVAVINDEEDNYTAYAKFMDAAEGVQEDIVIPETSVSSLYDVTHDVTHDEITNIQVNGTTDYIMGNWLYSSNIAKDWDVMYWSVRKNNNASTIKRPVLPSEVYNELGIDESQIEIECLEIMDYNTTTSLSEVVSRFNIYRLPYEELYDEYYYSRLNLGIQKRDEKLENRIDVNCDIYPFNIHRKSSH